MKLKFQVLWNPESHFREAKEPQVAEPCHRCCGKLKAYSCIVLQALQNFVAWYICKYINTYSGVKPENIMLKYYMHNGLTI